MIDHLARNLCALLAVYDAIGKFPISGVTGGNTHSLGSYTSCKDVNATKLKYDLSAPFGGKYWEAIQQKDFWL